MRTGATFSETGNPQRAPMPAAVLDQVAAVPGVCVAEGSVAGYAQFVGKDGKPVTTGGAPTLGVSLSTAPQLQAGATIRARAPVRSARDRSRSTRTRPRSTGLPCR